MAVTEVDIRLDAVEVPEAVAQLIERAAERVDRFIDSRLDDPIPGFVPSDFEAVYRSLASIKSSWLAPGEAFLEWGSGLGIVAMLAARLGFHAQGIEIEGALVDEAREIAADLDVPVEFHHGSFVPEGGEDLVPPMGEFAWLDTDGESAYEQMGLDIEDFDVVFAYPWPGEEDTVIDLFERYAATGALLVTYQGKDDVHVRRKVRKRR